MPAWWGAERWVSVDVALALSAHREWAREEHVLPETTAIVARIMARYADYRTGRDCRPTNEALAALAHLSVRQVQRARRLLKRLGLVVEVVRGRSFMTRAERMVAWAKGSRARKMAAEFALCSPRRPQASPRPVERVSPPGFAFEPSESRLEMGSRHGNRPKEERYAHPHGGQRRKPTPTLAQIKSQRLTAAVQRAVPWLSGVSPHRLRSLARFAAHGWTERDVVAGLHEALAARGWTVPAQLDRPEAYLAKLLRDLDEADRPGALEEAREDEARTLILWSLEHGKECRHGEPGGDVPHPSTGRPRCPLCRRAQELLA